MGERGREFTYSHSVAPHLTANYHTSGQVEELVESLSYPTDCRLHVDARCGQVVADIEYYELNGRGQ